jgi:hypothetical protein
MHALALRAPTDENFIFLIGQGILQCSMSHLLIRATPNGGKQSKKVL